MKLRDGRMKHRRDRTRPTSKFTVRTTIANRLNGQPVDAASFSEPQGLAALTMG